MNSRHKLQGGAIVSHEQHSHGIIELLTYRFRDRVSLIYYYHPFEIDLSRYFQFLIVLSLEDLEHTAKYYRLKQRRLPPVVHIGTPEALLCAAHQTRFPDLEIVPLRQADLADKDVTLQLTQFERFIDGLEARV
jgi:hypothetical protein